MPATNTKKTTPTTKKPPASVADIVVRRSKQPKKKAPMLTSNIVPAGVYRSTIIAVEDAHNDEGNLMADLTYSFTDTGGKSREARVRYPIVGYHIEKLIDALIDAGLPEESPLTDAVGIEEEVTIVYPHEGALGKIKSRQPANQAVTTALKKQAPKQVLSKKRKLLADDAEEVQEVEEVEDFDDEFDDFLEEDED